MLISPNFQERHRINMVAYGEQPHGCSAMARTVGYTAAIVSHMILDGDFFFNY
jgi:hypothetical protein